MRIVAGVYGSRRIRALKGSRVRPTTDAVKEALFAILRTRVHDARTLDLFAGSGNLGIEALSRGAQHATFVDNSSASIRTVRQNLAELDVPKTQTRLIRADASTAIADLAIQHATFDLIFLDPPYDSTLAHESLQSLGLTGSLLSHEATIVVEHDPSLSIADFYGILTRVRVERYGNTSVSLYRRVASAD